jgi:hypothetical protein
MQPLGDAWRGSAGAEPPAWQSQGLHLPQKID